MPLWYPPDVMARMVEDRKQHEADLDRQVMQLHGELAGWNKILQQIDPELQMIRAPENARHPSLKPGYYHILRIPKNGLPMIQVVEDKATGAFREPTSRDIEDLKAGDMWSDRARKGMEERNRKIEQAAKQRKEQERNDRVEEFIDRYRHHNVPKISVPRSLSGSE